MTPQTAIHLRLMTVMGFGRCSQHQAKPTKYRKKTFCFSELRRLLAKHVAFTDVCMHPALGLSVSLKRLKSSGGFVHFLDSVMVCFGCSCISVTSLTLSEASTQPTLPVSGNGKMQTRYGSLHNTTLAVKKYIYLFS